MNLSLAAEPKRKGLFEPYYWAPKPSSSSGQAPGQSLLPLLFPEPLPSLHLLDRIQLVRERVDSDASECSISRLALIINDLGVTHNSNRNNSPSRTETI